MATPAKLLEIASLFVGDLHPDVTDEQLFSAFSAAGGLYSVHVCRDHVSRRSLGRAYVNFVSALDAKSAITKLNNTPLNGKLMRVMWSRRDPGARNSGVRNLYVKNLHESIDNAKLQAMFSLFGNIESCKVAMTEDGRSRGFGFVQFDSQESADAAINGINGSVVKGKKIYVGNFVKKSERIITSPGALITMTSSAATFTNLYVKNFSPDVSEGLLRELFSRFGNISSLVIAKDNDGKSRCFGFVGFDRADDAKRAMESMNGKNLGSMTLYVARAQKKAEREQILRKQFEEKHNEKMFRYEDSNLYVKNINDDVSDIDLWQYFSQCGTIISAKVMRDDKGMNRGFGFVCFTTLEEAKKAVQTLHGRIFYKKPLYVGFAQKKADRHAQLQLQYAQDVNGLPGPGTAAIPAVYSSYYYPPQQTLFSGVHSMFPTWYLRPGGGAYSYTPYMRAAYQPMRLPMIPNIPGVQYKQSKNSMIVSSKPPKFHSKISKPHSQKPTQLRKLVEDGGNHQANIVCSGASCQSPGMFSGMLASASPDDQKMAIRKRLLPLVDKLKHEVAPKITDMLLEMENTRLLWLLESPHALADKIEEAEKSLKQSNVKVAMTATTTTTL